MRGTWAALEATLTMAPGAARLEVRHQRAQQVERSADIDGQALLPVVDRQRVERAQAQHAGGVDQHVRQRVLFGQAAAQRGHGVGVADVQRQLAHHAAMRGRLFELQVQRHDARAGLDEAARHLLAYALGRAGHPHALAGEIQSDHDQASCGSLAWMAAHQPSSVRSCAKSSKPISRPSFCHCATSSITRMESRP